MTSFQFYLVFFENNSAKSTFKIAISKIVSTEKRKLENKADEKGLSLKRSWSSKIVTVALYLNIFIAK